MISTDSPTSKEINYMSMSCSDLKEHIPTNNIGIPLHHCGRCWKKRSMCQSFIQYGYDCDGLRPKSSGGFICSPYQYELSRFKHVYQKGICLCISAYVCSCPQESIKKNNCICC
jgi:hypothetical protein